MPEEEVSMQVTTVRSGRPPVKAASIQPTQHRTVGRRRLLAISALALGVVVASTVGACTDSDDFGFEPRTKDLRLAPV